MAYLWLLLVIIFLLITLDYQRLSFGWVLRLGVGCFGWNSFLPFYFWYIIFIPESPRFLIASGQYDIGRNVLIKLYGSSVGESKVNEIKQSLLDEHSPRLSDLIDSATQKIRKIVWVGIGLAVFQQLVGINVVFYYGAVLWQAVGFSEADALLINIISGGVSIAACILTIMMVDKIGRKPLLQWGSVGMALSLGLMVIAFLNSDVGPGGVLDIGSWGPLALISANVYVFIFNMTWGPVMWVMLGEMFPNQIRGLWSCC